MAEQRALRVAVGVGRPDADDIRVLHVVSITLHNAITDPTPTKVGDLAVSALTLYDEPMDRQAYQFDCSEE